MRCRYCGRRLFGKSFPPFSRTAQLVEASPEGVCQRVEPGPVQRGRASGWSRVQSRGGVPAGGARSRSGPEGGCASGWSRVRSRGGVPAGGAGSVQRGRASGWSRVRSRGGVPAGGAGSSLGRRRRTELPVIASPQRSVRGTSARPVLWEGPVNQRSHPPS